MLNRRNVLYYRRNTEDHKEFLVKFVLIDVIESCIIFKKYLIHYYGGRSYENIKGK